MAILYPTLVPAKALKDGKNKIRIAVSHNSETRYIVTNIVVKNNEFKNGMIVRNNNASYLNIQMRKKLQEYQTILDGISYSESLSCSELTELIKNYNKAKSKTLESICDEYVNVMNIKESSKEIYRFTKNVLIRFFGESFAVQDVTYNKILLLEKFLRDRNLSQGTIHDYMSILKIFLNYARRCQYIEYKINPFEGYRMPGTRVRQCWIDIRDLRKIRDFKSTKKGITRARDIFMLSYYLGGINIEDLIHIDFNRFTNTIKYKRRKTERIEKDNEYVEFIIPDEAKVIIRKYKKKNGYLMLGNISASKQSIIQIVDRNLKNIQNNMECNRLVFYSARKSFAQHAFELGINQSVIEYLLGHSLKQRGTVIFHYIKVTPDMATEALKKVIGYLNADKIAVEDDDK